MKRKTNVLAILLAISLGIFSCSKKNETNESGNNTPGGNTPSCDTANMKYSANVVPILQANCYSCHANSQASGGISIDSHIKLKSLVDNGKLIGSITHTAGYRAMPLNQPKLSECDISKIKAWIARGAQNN